MKHFSTKFLIFVLLVAAILSGYNYFKRPFLARFGNLEQQLELVETLPAPDPIQLAVDQLTTREKVLQLIAYPVVLETSEASLSAELAWIEANRPGFVTLFGSSIDATPAAQFVQSTRFTAGYLPLIAVDHEGGTVQRLSGDGFTRLPSWRQVCQLAASTRKELFSRSAQELSQVGIQLIFSPVVDVARDGSFLGSRACLTEGEVVSTATDYIQEFARFGVLSVIKHFPGIGSVTRDLHDQLDSVELEPRDTIVFDRLLGTFPNIGVMTTHVVVPERTAGVPCSLNAACLDRFPANFPQVVLFTDALEMRAAGLVEGETTPKTLSTVATQALLAGNDVLVFGETISAETVAEVIAVLEENYMANENFRRRVDDSVTKILKLKLPQEGE
ncbi:MAG: Beta-glucosidase-like protein glycosyl hydrolase [Candidatus Pacebacteria bacterium GW2011_GWA1_46_10]|nr:MAG: Beta-glucosidase-like protein glycosyl hydrolase [Candidatus Pacebacteria bacterium GW2011_GWA1_46_10]HCR80965.1 hypothetical protein [Candidatus Paceibacterota bacterium]